MTVSDNARRDICAHLKAGKIITNALAWELFGCRSISSVIRDLKRGVEGRPPMKIKSWYCPNLHNNGQHAIWRAA